MHNLWYVFSGYIFFSEKVVNCSECKKKIVVVDLLLTLVLLSVICGMFIKQPDREALPTVPTCFSRSLDPV